jgi:hypothetical protein
MIASGVSEAYPASAVTYSGGSRAVPARRSAGTRRMTAACCGRALCESLAGWSVSGVS